MNLNFVPHYYWGSYDNRIRLHEKGDTKFKFIGHFNDASLSKTQEYSFRLEFKDACFDSEILRDAFEIPNLQYNQNSYFSFEFMDVIDQEYPDILKACGALDIYFDTGL